MGLPSSSLLMQWWCELLCIYNCVWGVLKHMFSKHSTCHQPIDPCMEMETFRKQYRSILCHKRWRTKNLMHCPLKAMKRNSQWFQWTLSLILSAPWIFSCFWICQIVSFAYRQTINVFSLWRCFKISRDIPWAQTLISLTSHGKSFHIFLCCHPETLNHCGFISLVGLKIIFSLSCHCTFNLNYNMI